MTIEAFASAKINLTLHVTGQREDGYHLLDSLVAFADVGDRLWFEEGRDLSLEVKGPAASGVPVGPENLVWRAAELAGFSGHIILEKNLPSGAGIGGGSSDAAAVLRQFGGQGMAATLGADVPVCLVPTAQRMQGIGERLTALPKLPQIWAVLVNPGRPIRTPEVFAALRKKTNPPMPRELPPFRSARELIGYLAGGRNDLEAPAIAIEPVIDDVLRALSCCAGVSLVRMSGSGATCFGLFENRGLAEIAAREMSDAHHGWWVRDCQLS